MNQLVIYQFLAYCYYILILEASILTLAQNEVNIQYRYGNDFQAKSVIIITWEDLIGQKNDENKVFKILYKIIYKIN